MDFRSLYLAILVLGSTLYFSGCQDDPILEETGPDGTTGAPKSRAFITLIQINSFPSTNPAGLSWDDLLPAEYDTFGRPDLFLNITGPPPDPPVFWSQNSHFLNVNAGDTIPFFLLDNFEVVPLGSDIDVNIYDYELDPVTGPDSTLMGTVSFFIGQYPDPTPWPTYITNEQNGYSITLGLRWEE